MCVLFVAGCVCVLVVSLRFCFMSVRVVLCVCCCILFVLFDWCDVCWLLCFVSLLCVGAVVGVCVSCVCFARAVLLLFVCVRVLCVLCVVAVVLCLDGLFCLPSVVFLLCVC